MNDEVTNFLSPQHSNHNAVLPDDYMTKIKNLDELSKFFSQNNLTKDKEKPCQLTFNDSVKASFTSNNYYKKVIKDDIQPFIPFIGDTLPVNDSLNITPKNNNVVKAILNLLEEMNLGQLNFIKREIDRKLTEGAQY